MQFSVCATFSGIANDPKTTHEMTYDDVRRELRGIGIDFTETENGDSEYAYLSSEQFDVDEFLTKQCERISAENGVPIPPEDDRGFEWHREWLREFADAFDFYELGFWERWCVLCRDMQVNMILNRDQFDKFTSQLGLFATDCDTLGTLGGPLGFGPVPDIVFENDSSAMICSVRVTPIPGTLEKQLGLCSTQEDAHRIWSRLKRAVVSVYGC